MGSHVHVSPALKQGMLATALAEWHCLQGVFGEDRKQGTVFFTSTKAYCHVALYERPPPPSYYEVHLNLKLHSTKEVGGVCRELHGSTPSSKWKILYLVFDPRQRLPGGESLLLGLGRQCHSARAVALTEAEGLRHCRALLYFRQNGYMKRARSLTSCFKAGEKLDPWQLTTIYFILVAIHIASLDNATESRSLSFTVWEGVSKTEPPRLW